MFQGYTDCGFHGGDQIPTPHIDYLAHNGIILDNYYTPKICTPSRAALLTGRHPMQLGLQRSVIFASHPWGLGLNETIFPQYLKKFGYVTHAIGKVWLTTHTHLFMYSIMRMIDECCGSFIWVEFNLKYQRKLCYDILTGFCPIKAIHHQGEYFKKI